MTGRSAATSIWEAALAAADVGPLVRRALEREGPFVRAGSLTVDLGEVDRVLLLGAGKASAGMAAAVEEIVGDRIAAGLVVVKDGYARPLVRARVVEAGHPVPDARGERAAAELLALAESATDRDLIIFALSGGASALLPAPAPPLSLEDKRQVTRLLLAAGANIHELNAVRKHLSLIKGGQLARAAAPAAVLTLALSDVVGNALDVIGSGPTAPDRTTFADALRIVDRFALRDRLPAAAVERLQAGGRGEAPETPKADDPMFARITNEVIGDNSLVVDAAAGRATLLGYRVEVLTRALAGEAREVAQRFVEHAKGSGPRSCLIAAGETTVTVRGEGNGGRCQEWALAAALALDGIDGITVLAAGTDGTDGPTDAAGAIADGRSVARAIAGGIDPRRCLADNDSYRVFARLGDLVVSGPTVTNLLDLYIAIVDRTE
jgi:hydroxypyruvate reductase